MSAFYVKNVPGRERVARIVFGAAIACAGFIWLPSPWRFVAIAMALGAAGTGLIGYCPMCAMIDRRPKVGT